jgi:hypothetical protein
LCCSAENSVLAQRSLILSPYVERLPADPVVTARLGDVARDLLGMTDHLQPMLRLPLEFLLYTRDLPSAHGEVGCYEETSRVKHHYQFQKVPRRWAAGHGMTMPTKTRG